MHRSKLKPDVPEGLPLDDVHRKTGAAWDEAAAIYERDEAEQIALLKTGGNTLLEPEQRILGDISSWCRRAVHLQCAGGSDTLSLLRQGASEVVGVDISPRMVAVARRKGAALAASASFFCADVFYAPPELDGTADLVYTGRGALPWMMDIRVWARTAARIMKVGGRLFVLEGHPLDWVWDATASEYTLDSSTGDYFSPSYSDARWPNSLLDGHNRHVDAPRALERHWKLGDVINALIAAGLSLERFEEHPDLYWGQFPHLPDDLARRLPHTFSLLMRKT